MATVSSVKLSPRSPKSCGWVQKTDYRSSKLPTPCKVQGIFRIITDFLVVTQRDFLKNSSQCVLKEILTARSCSSLNQIVIFVSTTGSGRLAFLDLEGEIMENEIS